MVGELKRHFRDKGWAIRVPRRMQEIGLRVNAVLPELSQELGRSPTIEEIAARCGATAEEILEAIEASQAYSTSSIDAPVGEEGVAPVEVLGVDDPSLALLDEWASIAPAVRDLPKRERTVLYLRFFRGLTQSEIATEIGVSQMHVSRILSQTLRTLRAAASGEPIPSVPRGRVADRAVPASRPPGPWGGPRACPVPPPRRGTGCGAVPGATAPAAARRGERRLVPRSAASAMAWISRTTSSITSGGPSIVASVLMSTPSAGATPI